MSQCSGVGWGRRETAPKFSEVKLNSKVFYLGSSVGTNSSATHSLDKNGNLDSLCLANKGSSSCLRYLSHIGKGVSLHSDISQNTKGLGDFLPITIF